MCPGREFTLEMMIDVMDVVYGPDGIQPHWRRQEPITSGGGKYHYPFAPGVKKYT